MKHIDPAELTGIPVSLPQWDSQIAPVLHQIEAHAHAIASHATAIASVMAILELRPKWQTKAGAAVDDALQTIANARGKLEAARQAYRNKPVMAEPADDIAVIVAQTNTIKALRETMEAELASLPEL